MKGYFYAIFFTFLGLFFFFLAIDYMKINMKILNDKDDLWKESLYYGSNKAYFRTASKDTIDGLTLADLYCKNKDDIEDKCSQDLNGNGTIDPDEQGVDFNDQLKLELIKDVEYYLDKSEFSYKIAAKESKNKGCKFDIYVSRRTKMPMAGESEAEQKYGVGAYNTVKVSLCKRKVS